MINAGLTGSTGMIGRHMKALLNRHGIECRCVNRDQWDLGEWKTYQELDELFEGVDVIFHFGAALPKVTESSDLSNLQTQIIFDANVRSCLNLAEWALLREVAVVFLSGATVYKNPCGHRISEGSLQVKSGFGGFYGYSKLLAEKVFEHFVEQGLKLTILRPSSVYGTGLGSDKLISNYLRLASSDKQITVESPDNRINLIHALDVAQSALLAFQNKAWGVYNVAAEISPSIQELAKTIVSVCGGGRVIIDDQLNKQAPFIRFDLDTQKANHDFLFKQTISLQEGLTLMHQKKEIEC